jgi:hypothetical protein
VPSNGTICARSGQRSLLSACRRSEAVEHFSFAMQATTALGQVVRPALHRYRGLAHAVLGDFEAARHDHEAAL